MAKQTLTLIIISLFFYTGCAWFETKPEKTADDLINEGMIYFEKGKYKDAIEAFEKLKSWYPFSKYAILAELKMADSHYHLEEYEQAVAEYEFFERLHPRNEAIPYVIYQTGLCYSNQIDTIDRDQTSAQKALDTFNRLINQFPKDEYAEKSKAEVVKCQKSLAGHELYVGMYYYKAKHYKTALSRFENVIANYPNIEGIHEKARYYIELCEEFIKKQK